MLRNTSIEFTLTKQIENCLYLQLEDPLQSLAMRMNGLARFWHTIGSDMYYINPTAKNHDSPVIHASLFSAFGRRSELFPLSQQNSAFFQVNHTIVSPARMNALRNPHTH